MKMKVKRFMAVFLSVMVIILGVHSEVFGKEIEKKPVGVNNSENLQQFIDDFFKKDMKKYSVPGAAIVVVKDGKEVLKKGFGYSNLEEKGSSRSR